MNTQNPTTSLTIPGMGQDSGASQKRTRKQDEPQSNSSSESPTKNPFAKKSKLSKTPTGVSTRESPKGTPRIETEGRNVEAEVLSYHTDSDLSTIDVA